MIPYGRQEITPEDIKAVVEVLQSDFLTQGPKVPEFEKAVADCCNARYGIAVNSGTSALHIACLALGVGKGDVVWTTPITFVASANCARYCGAEIDFVDIDPQTSNMSISKLENKLAHAARENCLPKVVIPVHLCGQSCEMEKIGKLADKYDFKVIEDACHALGGKYHGKPVGNCQYSDITVFSFHPVKIITTGEGGIAVTNQTELAEKMDLFRSHGITRDTDKMSHDSDGPWYYQQLELGFNYRMTDIQAALGLSQLRRLDEIVEKRRRLAERYDQLLQELPLILPYQLKEIYSSFHLYVVRLDFSQINISHKEVFKRLRAKGIGVNLHYIPVHTQPYYQNLGFREGCFLEAEKYYSQALSLPLYPHLSEKEQDQVVNCLQSIVR